MFYFFGIHYFFWKEIIYNFDDKFVKYLRKKPTSLVGQFSSTNELSNIQFIVFKKLVLWHQGNLKSVGNRVLSYKCKLMCM